MKDRRSLNDLIQKEKRSYDEENFDEALAASFRACRKTEIPSEIKAILHDHKATNLTPEVFSPFPHSLWLSLSVHVPSLSPSSLLRCPTVLFYQINCSQQISGFWRDVWRNLSMIQRVGMECYRLWVWCRTWKPIQIDISWCRIGKDPVRLPSHSFSPPAVASSFLSARSLLEYWIVLGNSDW